MVVLLGVAGFAGNKNQKMWTKAQLQPQSTNLDHSPGVDVARPKGYNDRDCDLRHQ